MILTGFLTEIDKYGRCKVMFLEDYDDDSLCPLTLTKAFLKKKQKENLGNSPLTLDGKHFYCKSPKLGFINEVPCPINSLIQCKINIVADIKRYRFEINGKLREGWHIKASKISKAE